MKSNLYILIVSVTVFSCGHSTMKTNEIEFYDINEDKFTFLVFDKSKVDTFNTKFKPLEFSNDLIKQELVSLTKIETDSNSASNLFSFTKNSKNPDTLDFNLALNVINATINNQGKEYFNASLEYLFFYNCLPDSLQYKWAQSNLGDFSFNVTFFSILRDKSDIINKLIYREIPHQDEKSFPIFKEQIYNEITSDQAKQIKQLILGDIRFDDSRFRTDRDNFIFFLDKTIYNEWRLLLVDRN